MLALVCVACCDETRGLSSVAAVPVLLMSRNVSAGRFSDDGERWALGPKQR